MLRGSFWKRATRLVAASRHARKSELVIDPEFHSMDLLVDIRGRARRKRDGFVAEVHEVVLELRRPGWREGVLNARPRGPADSRVGEIDSAGEAVDVGRDLVVPPGAAPLATDEPGAEGKAGAAGQCRGPVHIGVE